MEKRIANAETHQVRVLLPADLNDHQTLFGGKAMQWMDEVAYITATRFTGMHMVTVSVEKVRFLSPATLGDFIETVGFVTRVTGVKLEILVEMFAENHKKRCRTKAVEAKFIFAAVDRDNHPIRLESENYSNTQTKS
jgi:acyl-CoA hydrolase